MSKYSSLLNDNHLDQRFPTFFDAFHLFFIFEHFVPPLWNFQSSTVPVRRLLLTTNGTTVFIDDYNLIQKSGTKTICCQIMALKSVNKNV